MMATPLPKSPPGPAANVQARKVQSVKDRQIEVMRESGPPELGTLGRRESPSVLESLEGRRGGIPEGLIVVVPRRARI